MAIVCALHCLSKRLAGRRRKGICEISHFASAFLHPASVQNRTFFTFIKSSDFYSATFFSEINILVTDVIASHKISPGRAATSDLIEPHQSSWFRAKAPSAFQMFDQSQSLLHYEVGRCCVCQLFFILPSIEKRVCKERRGSWKRPWMRSSTRCSCTDWALQLTRQSTWHSKWTDSWAALSDTTFRRALSRYALFHIY